MRREKEGKRQVGNTGNRGERKKMERRREEWRGREGGREREEGGKEGGEREYVATGHHQFLTIFAT